MSYCLTEVVDRLLATANRDWECAAQAKLSIAPVPPDFPTDVLVKVHLPGEQRMATTLHCPGDQTFLGVMHQLAKKSQATREGQLDPADYVFKITGRNRYVVQLDRKLHQIDYVRYLHYTVAPNRIFSLNLSSSSHHAGSV